MNFHYSYMCNGSLPCCAIWFGYCYNQICVCSVLHRSSNSHPLFPIRPTSIFQRCGRNPTGALVSRAIVEYKMHLILSPLWHRGEQDSLRSSFLRWVLEPKQNVAEGLLRRVFSASWEGRLENGTVSYCYCKHMRGVLKKGYWKNLSSWRGTEKGAVKI